MEVDGFEVLSRLRKFLLGAATSSQNFKGAVSLCNKYAAEMTSELFDCILESLVEDIKSRRAVIGIIEALYCSGGAFKALVKDNFRHIVITSLPPNGPANWNRNAAKALKSLHSCMCGTSPPEASDLEAMIDNVLGLSQGEKVQLQKRQTILDQVEKDREGHKQLREACWSRPEGELDGDEFLTLFYRKATPNFSLLERDLIGRNISRFYYLNGLEKPTIESREARRPVEATTKVVIIHLGEIIFNFYSSSSSSFGNRESKVRHCIGDVDASVKEVAKKCFFYNDLRGYDQPHVKYYCDDDDGRRLDDYDFRHDDLATFLQVSPASGSDSDRKFYRERAYRHRMAAQRYSEPALLTGLLPRPLAKDYERHTRDLDHLMKGAVYRSIKVIRELALETSSGGGPHKGRLDIKLCYLTGEHLGLALARNVVFGLSECISPKALYSTTKFDASWVVSEIQAKYGKKAKYLVLGSTKPLRSCSERLGCEFVSVSSVSELILAVRNITQGSPS